MDLLFNDHVLGARRCFQQSQLPHHDDFSGDIPTLKGGFPTKQVSAVHLDERAVSQPAEHPIGSWCESTFRLSVSVKGPARTMSTAPCLAVSRLDGLATLSARSVIDRRVAARSVG